MAHSEQSLTMSQRLYQSMHVVLIFFDASGTKKCIQQWLKLVSSAAKSTRILLVASKSDLHMNGEALDYAKHLVQEKNVKGVVKVSSKDEASVRNVLEMIGTDIASMLPDHALLRVKIHLLPFLFVVCCLLTVQPQS